MVNNELVLIATLGNFRTFILFYLRQPKELEGGLGSPLIQTALGTPLSYALG